MNELEKNRIEINEIDRQMASLFEKRMEISKNIAEYKIKNGLSVLDKSREQEILTKNVKYIKNEDLADYYTLFLKSTMDISKKYQEKLFSGLKVAYCGVEGAFGYIATKNTFSNSQLISCGDFTKAYKGVENGDYDCAVLPIENSYAGDVGVVMDLMFSGSLYVNKMIEIPVEHCLIGVKGTKISDVKTVVSHSQALMQCEDFISQNNFSTQIYSNTALAGKYVLELNDKSVVAIASKETAEILGLEVIRNNINDSRNNTTRFAVFSRVQNLPSKDIKNGNEHFILNFTTKNEAGSLAQALNIIGAHDFNMKSLRSRPMKDLIWNYYFFVEIEGNVSSVDGQNMLKELSAICEKLKLVGAYN